jgi:hypothetical protein
MYSYFVFYLFEDGNMVGWNMLGVTLYINWFQYTVVDFWYCYFTLVYSINPRIMYHL